MNDIFLILTMIDVHMKTFEKRFDEEFHRWIIKTDVEQIKQEFQQNHSSIQNDEIQSINELLIFSNKEKRIF